MNARALLMIGVSALIGLAAVFAAAQWIARQTSVPTAKVVVAATDLDLGTRLSAEMLQVVEWPSGAMMKGTVADPKTLEGRVINASVLRSEPIVDSKLAPAGATGERDCAERTGIIATILNFQIRSGAAICFAG